MSDFTEPTTGYWQQLESEMPPERRTPPWRLGVPVQLRDGRWLVLPIRKRAGDDSRAVASLIANQASFAVADALAAQMADLVRELAPEVIVGLPTLGLALAPTMARLLGHGHFVPLGYSRKTWYDEALSEPVSSITTTTQRRLYLDPNMLPRLAGRRIVVVDDTISTGTTTLAAIRLLARSGAKIAGLVFAMSQGRQWVETLGADWAGRVHYVFQTPHLVRVAEGWVPV